MQSLRHFQGLFTSYSSPLVIAPQERYISYLVSDRLMPTWERDEQGEHQTRECYGGETAVHQLRVPCGGIWRRSQ